MKPLSPSTGTKSYISVDRFNAILKGDDAACRISRHPGRADRSR